MVIGMAVNVVPDAVVYVVSGVVAVVVPDSISGALGLSFKRLQNRLGSHRYGKTGRGYIRLALSHRDAFEAAAAVLSETLALTGWE